MLKPEALRPPLAEARPQSEAFGRGAPGGPVLRHPAPAGSTKPRAQCPGSAEAFALKPEALRPPLIWGLSSDQKRSAAGRPAGPCLGIQRPDFPESLLRLMGLLAADMASCVWGRVPSMPAGAAARACTQGVPHLFSGLKLVLALLAASVRSLHEAVHDMLD